MTSMHLGKLAPTGPEPHRFYDGGTDSEPPEVSRPPVIVLERDHEAGTETFRMRRRLGYVDRHLGELLVPADLAEFRTDLTSVPRVFTWLVPRTGEHLPAALLHDGLLGHDTYLSAEGHRIGRVRADRVFRDAMCDAHTGPVRRWLVWSAVTLETIRRGPAGWSPGRRWRMRAIAAVTLVAIAVLGVVTTVDLLDAAALLPWMGERPWWVELLGGAAAAVVIPLVLGLAWGELRAAGMVVGVAFALLFHVTVALLVLTALYWVTEQLARRISAASTSPSTRRRSAPRRPGS